MYRDYLFFTISQPTTSALAAGPTICIQYPFLPSSPLYTTMQLFSLLILQYYNNEKYVNFPRKIPNCRPTAGNLVLGKVYIFLAPAAGFCPFGTKSFWDEVLLKLSSCPTTAPLPLRYCPATAASTATAATAATTATTATTATAAYPYLFPCLFI